MSKIIIDEQKYKHLLKRDLELRLLEHAGVDNWTWYGEHWNELREKYPELEDEYEMLELEIEEILKKERYLK